MKSTLATCVWMMALCGLRAASAQPMAGRSVTLPWHGSNITVVASTSLWNTLSGFWTNDLKKSMFETTNEYRARLQTIQPTHEAFILCPARPVYDADRGEFRFSTSLDQLLRQHNSPGSSVRVDFQEPAIQQDLSFKMARLEAKKAYNTMVGVAGVCVGLFETAPAFDTEPSLALHLEHLIVFDTERGLSLHEQRFRTQDTEPDAIVSEASGVRPRTLAVLRRTEGVPIAGKMRQGGGASDPGTLSVNVKGTPSGAYDAAFIAAVQQRWYDLMDNSQVVRRPGKVVLQFRLLYDGRITDMKVNENNVGELLCLLCQRAVLDPAPYARWPSDMRQVMGENYRDLTFTFQYNRGP